MSVVREFGSPATQTQPTFIDLFAGCGGLSLGLLNAGWSGVLAIEKDALAFSTIDYNLIQPQLCPSFDWAPWFPKEPCSVADFNIQYGHELAALRGQLTLVAGGAPCQGFSLAGRRELEDERNSLFRDFLHTVEILSPAMVVLENVHAITVPFLAQNRHVNRVSVADQIRKSLDTLGYNVFNELVKCQHFGVPQRRARYFMVGVKRALVKSHCSSVSPLAMMRDLQPSFLESKNLASSINIVEAISDLEARWGTVESLESPRFQRGIYGKPDGIYQKMLRVDRRGNAITDGVLPDSHRFANHAPRTIDHFLRVLECRRGVHLSKEDRQRLGIKKQSLTPLASDQLCHTLTTLPDDYLHYSEPRILTVREYARIQSFPDWFEFRGKYTTGGRMRKRECPRYTQAGNAVPPLVAEILGLSLLQYAAEALDLEIPHRVGAVGRP